MIIPMAKPDITEREVEMVSKAVREGEISPKGKYALKKV